MKDVLRHSSASSGAGTRHNRLLSAVMILVALGTIAAHGADKAKVDGYLEYRRGGLLIVEGQRVLIDRQTKLKGPVASIHRIPLGYRIEAEGTRRADGAIHARRLNAKPNGTQMYEAEVRQATDELENFYRRQGQMLTAAPGGGTASLGRLLEDGPYVQRARRVVDRVLPPYLEPEDVRVYAIENAEWNAMAMGNYSIYVFTGLMDDTDDDELAIVLGHELAHATHEHTRRQHKQGLWVQVGSVAAAVALSEVDNGSERWAASMLAGLGATAFANGYSRDLEDQADQVGLRYAYEGGYDVTKGPQLWARFAEKYGEAGKAQNILFGDHSRSSVRAEALQREIEFNYRSPEDDADRAAPDR